MNKAKMSTKQWNSISLQQVDDQVHKATCIPVTALNTSEFVLPKSTSDSSYGINVRKMVEDAAKIREQKAHAVKTSELSGTKPIEPTRLFHKRTGGR